MKCSFAMFPGSFDPPTNGHLDIISRASALYGKVYVVVGENAAKKTLFTASERKALLEDMVKDLGNVQVCIWSGLCVDFARENGVDVIVKGVRNIQDFEYEREMAQVNRALLPTVETVLLPADPEKELVRSSYVRELAAFGADIGKMVPPAVAKALCEKLGC